MTSSNLQMASRLLGLLGVIFIMAMAFDVMVSNVALFAAMVCFILSGGIYSLGRG